MNVKPAGGGGIGRGFDRSLWPWDRAFELPCCPGSRDIWFLFVPGTTNHFLGWGISVIFDLTFLPGSKEFDSYFWENVKIPTRLVCTLWLRGSIVTDPMIYRLVLVLHGLKSGNTIWLRTRETRNQAFVLTSPALSGTQNPSCVHSLFFARLTDPPSPEGGRWETKHFIGMA